MPPPTLPYPLEKDPIQASMSQKAEQFLVHSFLYYQLNESLISDIAFDALSKELWILRQQHPDISFSYQSLLGSALGEEASGYRLAHYPPAIITAAFQLLFAARVSTETQLKNASLPLQNTQFEQFVARYGYHCQWP